MTIGEFRDMALSFPGTEENAHFDRAAFKVVKKRIFATLHEESGTANIKLLPADQRVFCDFDSEVVYPVPNKWGLQGWTTFNLKKVPNELMLDALNTAYENVFSEKKKKK
jgi:predicted DNA-binding protein (MmcQ/YjbR family)